MFLFVILSTLLLLQTPDHKTRSSWNAPHPPFRIYGNTFYVGSAGLSAILIASTEGHVLVDGGLPESAPAGAGMADGESETAPPAACDAAPMAPPVNGEARQCYLTGRSFLLKGVWSKRALEVARQQFAKAMAIDPHYALAHAAMASLDCYRLLLGLPDASFDVIAANSGRARSARIA